MLSVLSLTNQININFITIKFICFTFFRYFIKFSLANTSTDRPTYALQITIHKIIEIYLYTIRNQIKQNWIEFNWPKWKQYLWLLTKSHISVQWFLFLTFNCSLRTGPLLGHKVANSKTKTLPPPVADIYYCCFCPIKEYRYALTLCFFNLFHLYRRRYGCPC